MRPKLRPISVTIAAATVVSIIEDALTNLNIQKDGIVGVQIDLPSTFAGKLHPWCQNASQTNVVPVGDVRKMTPYVYLEGQPLTFNIDGDTDLLVATDVGTAGPIDVMVTLWT